MFHYLYPPLSIGLGVLLVFMEGMYLKTGNPLYESMTKFWVKIFALSFAMGVVSGITMSFQFGTNWPGYMRDYVKRTRVLDPDEYTLVPSPARAPVGAAAGRGSP